MALIKATGCLSIWHGEYLYLNLLIVFGASSSISEERDC